MRALSVASWLCLVSLLVDVAAATEGPLTLSFHGQEYIHRRSEGDQHEFTPAGQEDLSSWTDMLTMVVYPDVGDGEELATVANNVLGLYRDRGRIIKTDSVRRTRRRPAEHLVVAVLPTATLLEVVFCRLMLIDDTGVAIVASHRVYGSRAGDAASAWLRDNGPDWEEALMSWKSMPDLSSLGDPPDETVGLIVNLRGHLDLVRTGPAPFNSKPWPRPDVSKLVGLARQELQQGLGEPTTCSSAASRASEEVDCSEADRWLYAFYSLPPGARGGGLELILEFSADGSCRSSEWRRTQ